MPSAPAMSRRQAEKLLLDVIRYTQELAKNGVTLFGVGELGWQTRHRQQQ